MLPEPGPHRPCGSGSRSQFFMRIRADPGSETDSEETRTGNFFYSFPRLIYCTVPDPGKRNRDLLFIHPGLLFTFRTSLSMHYEIDLVKIDVEEKKN